MNYIFTAMTADRFNAIKTAKSMLPKEILKQTAVMKMYLMNESAGKGQVANLL